MGKFLKIIRRLNIKGVTLAEILIAVAMFAVAFMPIASIISKTTRKTHDMNYEITAETIGKSILEQIIKTVPFDKVTPDITVGLEDGKDVKLDFTDKSAIAKIEFTGDKSGSVIKYEGAEYKWEIEIKNLDAKDLPLSYWDPRNDKPKGATPWPTNLIGTKNDAVQKVEKFENITADNFAKGGKNIIMKTIKLRISWQIMNEKGNDFKDDRRKFILVSRKARIEYDQDFR
ncbi:MAG TPA: hypothetical protein PKK26_03910 [Candidatus Wallbacteria bacterium]|nr:hypothetical protein [Candidatus Wallbacteria bacterium]